MTVNPGGIQRILQYEGRKLMFRQDMRRAVASPLFIMAVAITLVCLLISAWPEIRFTNELLYLTTMGWYGASNIVCILLPLFSGLIYADAYCVEKKDGFHYSVISRGSKLRYGISKVCTANLCAALMILVVTLLFMGACVLIFKGDLTFTGIPEPDDTTVSDDFFHTVSYMGNDEEVMMWEHVFYDRGQPFMILLSWIMSYALAASIWPGMALCASLFIRSRYVVLAVPFLVEQVWDTIVVALKLNISSNQLLPLANSYAPDGNWPVRLVIVGTIWALEIMVFSYGIVRETR